jgi:voltage-gated potassium channel Kch
MSLSTRFGVDVISVVAGGFLAVAAMAFSAPLAGWVGFGVFTGLTVLGGVAAVFTTRRGARIGHGLLGLVGLWALIAALVFTGSAGIWLVFADALAVALLGLADLTAHEATTERVVHQLEVHSAPVVTSTAA